MLHTLQIIKIVIVSLVVKFRDRLSSNEVAAAPWHFVIPIFIFALKILIKSWFPSKLKRTNSCGFPIPNSLVRHNLTTRFCVSANWGTDAILKHQCDQCIRKPDYLCVGDLIDLLMQNLFFTYLYRLIILSAIHCLGPTRLDQHEELKNLPDYRLKLCRTHMMQFTWILCSAKLDFSHLFI